MTATRERGLRIAETSAALGLIVMRIAVQASEPWWTDWAVPAAAAWLVCANVPPRSRAAGAAAKLLMGFLALIYLLRMIGRGT